MKEPPPMALTQTLLDACNGLLKKVSFLQQSNALQKAAENTSFASLIERPRKKPKSSFLSEDKIQDHDDNRSQITNNVTDTTLI
jgi:hypothetical protein